jgi:ribosome-associated translation inhibitor RaiA
MQAQRRVIVRVPMEQPIEFVIRSGRPDTVDTLRAYASHRLSLALRRFEQRIRRVIVRVSDLNGPRRGVDSKCSITAELIDGRQVFVNATTAWPFTSVTRAAGRLNEALRREVERTAWRRPGALVGSSDRA